MAETRQHSTQPGRATIWVMFAAFAAMALYFLWDEHEAHIRGALPYLLLLLCPLLHLFMHRGHRGASSRTGQNSDGHSKQAT
jgi:hypothetical protein